MVQTILQIFGVKANEAVTLEEYCTGSYLCTSCHEKTKEAKRTWNQLLELQEKMSSISTAIKQSIATGFQKYQRSENQEKIRPNTEMKRQAMVQGNTHTICVTLLRIFRPVDVLGYHALKINIVHCSLLLYFSP